jgi:hypothetical protein
MIGPKTLRLAVFTPWVPSNDFLNEIMWTRREIENYFCSEAVLLAWAAHDTPDDLFGLAERENRLRAMNEAIAEVTQLLEIDDKDPWSPDVKATDEVLDRVFRVFFKKVNLPLSFRKRDYHLLVGFLAREQIDPEVVAKLNAIVQVAQRVQPLPI